VVFSYMGIPTRRFLASRRRRAEMTLAACRGASVTTSLSRGRRGRVPRDPRVETRVIHPGVDLRAFAPLVRARAKPLIFCAASLDVGYKRVDM